MKKLILLAIIAMSFIACSNNKSYSTLIKEQQFIENLNSFSYFAKYEYVGYTDSSFVFIVNEYDSLYVYNVEQTKAVEAIYDANNSGFYVK